MTLLNELKFLKQKKIDGKRQRKINIHFKGIGLVDFD